MSTCTICLEPCDTPYQSYSCQCKAVYHKNCILLYLREKSKPCACPICRTSISAIVNVAYFNKVEEVRKPSLAFLKNINLQNHRKQLVNIYNSITNLNLWRWLKYVEPVNGFCITPTGEINEIVAQVDMEDHSGTSFGIQMRILQNATR
jgi:hypothetical protein